MLDSLYRSLRDLEDMSARGASALLGLLFSGRLFKLIGQTHRTLAQAFDAAFGGDEAAKMALGAPLAYFDDDPAELSSFYSPAYGRAMLKSDRTISVGALARSRWLSLTA